MATTSPDNLWTPDAGDDYALVTDLAATADTVQDAITALRGNVRYIVGTNAARLASTPTEGTRWRTTDTDRDWFYNGTSWLGVDPSGYLIFPTAAVSSGGTATIDASTGLVTVSGATTGVRLETVFSTRFQEFEVLVNCRTLSSSLNLRLVSGVTPAVSSDYDYSISSTSSGGASPVNSSGNATVWPMESFGSNARGAYRATIVDPAAAVRTQYFGQGQGSTATGSYQSSFGGQHRLATAYDGLQISSNVAFTGTIRVRGLS